MDNLSNNNQYEHNNNEENPQNNIVKNFAFNLGQVNKIKLIKNKNEKSS